MELKDYIYALRRRWWVFVLCTLVGVGLAATATALMPKTYEAKAELFVSPQSGSNSSELVQGSSYVLERVKSYARVITSAAVLEPVIEDLGLDTTIEDLAEEVRATVVTDTVVIVVAAESDSPEQAAQIANSIAERFIAVAPTLEPEHTATNQVVKISVTDPALPPQSPISPRTPINLALGLMMGIATGVALAVLWQALDRRVQSEDEVRRITDAPILGYIPEDGDAAKTPLAVGPGRFSPRAEQLRQVRTNLQFLDLPREARSYVVTSTVPLEGKTVTSLNLALTLAEGGNRVCFVEADLRRPTADNYLNLDPTRGLTHLLIGAGDLVDVVQSYEGHLDVILAGPIPPNPADLLAGGAMRDLIDELERTYDVVIIDAPPLLPVTDAALLAKRCSGALLVVALGRRAVARAALAHSVEILDTVGARLLGVVLNKVARSTTPGRVKGYSTYHPLPEEETRAGRRSRSRSERRIFAAPGSRSGARGT